MKDVIENYKKAIDLLKENEEYYSEFIDLQSKTDRKIDYWLHYIEFNNVKVGETYRIIKELKRLRRERRRYKNDFELIKVFKDNEQKLSNPANREMLLTNVCKTESKQKNAKYSYDSYTDEEKNMILGIKKENKNEEVERNN